MSKLDVLLVNPGGHKAIYSAYTDDIQAGLPAKEPPIWAGMMANFVRRRKLSVQILDANLEDLSPQETAERIKDINPLLAAFVIYGHQPSASTQTMAPAGDAARILKQIAPEQKILFVGGHVAALPAQTLQEEDADFSCGGEGPITVAELAAALKSGDREFRKVRDLWFWKDGRVEHSSPAPLITNLDEEMPGIAWDLLPTLDRYRAHDWHCYGRLNRRSPYAAIYTTLGCPYHCTFCCIQAPFKSGEKTIGKQEKVNTYRRWGLEKIRQWFEYLLGQCGVSNIKIADEMFVLNPQHVAGICDFIIERGWGEKLNIWAYSRVDTCRPEFIDKLRRAGFRWLAFGIESANAEVRKKADKGDFHEEEIYDVIKRVRNADINVIGNYIFGLPEDTRETMRATLDLAINLRTEAVNFYCAMAYPGSPLYEEAKLHGWALPPGWIGYSQHSYETLPLPTRNVSAAEVLHFRDMAFKEWHSHHHVLSYIEKRFGWETAEYLRKISQTEVRRRHYPK